MEPGEDGGQAQRIEREFPGWRAWRGVGATGWYGRKLLSSPPVVVRAATAGELRDAIAARVSR